MVEEREERFAAADMEKGRPSPRPVYWRAGGPYPEEEEETDPNRSSRWSRPSMSMELAPPDEDETKEIPVAAVSSSPASSSASTSGMESLDGRRLDAGGGG